MTGEGEKIYICPEGHQLNHEGYCPDHKKELQRAQFECKYCGYFATHSKKGICPSCGAHLEAINHPEAYSSKLGPAA